METILHRDSVFAQPYARDSFVSISLEIMAVAALMALAALVRFPLPFSPVPVTLQTFMVLVVPFAIDRHRAAAGMALYMGLGLAGAPLFAVASGATLGYLLAFVASPYIIRSVKSPLLGMIAATLCIYAAGAAWLSLWMGVSPVQAVVLGVVPFIPGNVVKLAGARMLIERLRR